MKNQNQIDIFSIQIDQIDNESSHTRESETGYDNNSIIKMQQLQRKQLYDWLKQVVETSITQYLNFNL